MQSRARWVPTVTTAVWRGRSRGRWSLAASKARAVLHLIGSPNAGACLPRAEGLADEIVVADARSLPS